MREFTLNAHFHDAVIHDGYMYFSETTFNGLFRVKEEGGEAEFLGRFPEEDPWQGDLHRALYLRENKIYFIPLNGRGISIYDIENNSFSMIWLVLNDNERARYCQTIDIDAGILLIPSRLNVPFAIFHLDSEKIEFHREINRRIMEKIAPSNEWEFFSAHGAIKDGDMLYLSVGDTNVVFSLSLKTWNVDMTILPMYARIRCMNKINDVFWFTLKEHSIIQWNPTTGSCNKHTIPGKTKDLNYPYLLLLKHGDNLLLLAGREDKIWEIDDKRIEWKDCTDYIDKSFQRDIQGSLLFLGYHADNESLILFPRSGNGVLKKKASEDVFSFIPVKYDRVFVSELRREWIKYLVKNNQLHFERDLALEDFLEGVDDKDSGIYNLRTLCSDNGIKIYTEIMNENETIGDK